MPQANDGLDYYVYQIINPIAEKLCFIHPNYITLASGLCGIPMAMNMYYHDSVYMFAFYTILKYVLDCLDGSVARKCNLTSNLGAILDVLADTITVYLFACVFLNKLFEKMNVYTYNTGLICLQLVVLYIFTKHLYGEIHGTRTWTGFELFIHNNLVAFGIIGPIICKLIIDYQQ